MIIEQSLKKKFLPFIKIDILDMCQTKGNSMVFTLYAIELPSMNHQGDIHDVHQKKRK